MGGGMRRGKCGECEEERGSGVGKGRGGESGAFQLQVFYSNLRVCTN